MGASVVVVVDDVVVELVVVGEVTGGWVTVGSLADEHDAASSTVAVARSVGQCLLVGRSAG
jgi:hypothetical protein